jgi:hypothetical protein
VLAITGTVAERAPPSGRGSRREIDEGTYKGAQNKRPRAMRGQAVLKSPFQNFIKGYRAFAT